MARNIRNKYLKAVLASVICTIVAAAVMTVYQSFSNNEEEDRKIEAALSDFPAQLDAESASRREQIAENDKDFQKDLAALKYIVETCGQKEFFEKIAENGGMVSMVYLVGKNGEIVNGTDEASIGKNIKQVCSLSEDEYSLIMKGDGYVHTDVRTMDDGSFAKIFATTCVGESEGLRLVYPVVLKGKYASVYSFGDLSGLFGVLDDRCFLVPIYNATQTFGTFKTEALDLSGQPISSINLDESVTREPSSGHNSALGYGYRYRTIQYSSDILGDITVLALYTDEGAVPLGPTIILLVSILILTFLIQLYCFYIEEEPGKLQIRAAGLRRIGKKSCTIDTEKARVILPFSIVSIVVVTLACFYFNTLYMVGTQEWSAWWNIRQITESLSKVENEAEMNYKAATEDMEVFMQVAASVLEDGQESLLYGKDASRLRKISNGDGTFRTVEINNPWLKGMSKVSGCSELSIFDGEGRLVATSGTQRNLVLSKENENTAPLFDVVNGISASCQVFDGNYFMIAVPMVLRQNGEIQDAMLVFRLKTDDFSSKEIVSVIDDIFDAASESGNCHYVMAVDGDERKAVYFPKALGTGLSDLKLPDAAFEELYVGFKKVNDVRYFVTTKELSGNRNDYTLTAFIPVGNIYAGRIGITVITFIVTLLVVALLLCFVLIYGEGKTEALKALAEKEAAERRQMSVIQLEKISVEMQRAPSSSQKILEMIKKIWRVVLGLFFFSLLRGMTTGPQETLSGYLMSFFWQRGINVFSITTMLIVAMSFAFVMFVLTKLMAVLGKALNAGAETVCQLLVSLLRYAGYITVIFVTLYMFGIDTTGVLASLGAFSVMVGLGAKNLITDILAGISIIMEKDYKVGDIVNIGGFCGKVAEIGIRTTKVEDIEGNVKIFYNSAVNGVVNMTSRLSTVTLDIKLSVEHSFEDVEKYFVEFFERVENKFTQIKEPCRYLGVQDSSPTFNVFRIMVPCDEMDRAPLRRALLREFSEFCTGKGLKKL